MSTNWRGIWNSSATYATNDGVIQNGTAFLAAQASTNQAPAIASSYWSTTVLPSTYQGPYSAGATYAAGNVVRYGASTYQLIVNSSTGVDPVTNTGGVWRQLYSGTSAGSYSSQGNWSATTAYANGDVVFDQGYIWLCETANTNSRPSGSNANWQLIGLQGDSSGSSGSGIDSIFPMVAAGGALLDFIQRWQDAGSFVEPYLISREWLVRNNMHLESGRAGYYYNDDATSEGQALMIRAAARMYLATGQIAFLTRAQKLATAFINYFAFGVSPPSSGDWPHHWLVNAGPAFFAKGPTSTESADYDGYIGVTFTFTDGVAEIDSNLATVYKVFDPTGTLLWDNVFATLTSGTEHNVSYYIDANGYRLDGGKANTGAWGNVATPGSTETKGKLVLSDLTFSGPLKVNYSVYLSTEISYGQAHEAWPMWRTLQSGEYAIATDALHWLADAFDLLVQADPTSTVWPLAKAATLRMWQNACTIDTSLDVFVKTPGATYNSKALTYFYIGYTSGPSIGAPASSSVIVYDRDSSGYVSLTVPADSSRAILGFENSALFFDYISASTSLVFEFSGSVAVPLKLMFHGADNVQYETRFLLTGSGTLDNPTFPIAQFTTFGSTAVWRPGDGVFGFTNGESYVDAMNGTVLVRRITLPTFTAGLGINKSQFENNFESPTPPRIAYATAATTARVRLVDGSNWNWEASLPAQTSIAERSFAWSDFSLSGYQTNTGTSPSSPDSTNPIQDVEFIQSSSSSITIDIAYVSAASPAIIPSSGTISLVSIQYLGTAALTLLIGHCYASGTGASRQSIGYYPGALPFLYEVGASTYSADIGTAAPFQGPFYTGYQNPIPWLLLGGSVSEITNMLQLLIDAQAGFTAQSAGHKTGPFAPIYLQSTWDAAQYGAVGSFTWAGPDPNTSWGGFQYRAFCNVADYWQRAVTAGLSDVTVTKAAQISNAMLAYIDSWLSANRSALFLPGDFPPTSNGSDDYSEIHLTAVAIKGAAFCLKAGGDPATCRRVINRLLTMLDQAFVNYGDMRGSHSADPDNHKAYGFWEAEILDALAVTVLSKDLLG